MDKLFIEFNANGRYYSGDSGLPTNLRLTNEFHWKRSLVILLAPERQNFAFNRTQSVANESVSKPFQYPN